jgi:hypothetical protein
MWAYPNNPRNFVIPQVVTGPIRLAGDSNPGVTPQKAQPHGLVKRLEGFVLSLLNVQARRFIVKIGQLTHRLSSLRTWQTNPKNQQENKNNALHTSPHDGIFSSK